MNDDLIKRSDAAEVVYKALKTPPPKGMLTDTMSLAIALVQDMPSADRLQGEWICKGDWAECSLCGADSGTIMDGLERVPRYTRFCPECGVRMKGADDEVLRQL